jgi:hypothetical protein
VANSYCYACKGTGVSIKSEWVVIPAGTTAKPTLRMNAEVCKCVDVKYDKLKQRRKVDGE